MALRGIEQRGRYSLLHFLCPEIAPKERMTWRWLQVLYPSIGGRGPRVSCLHMGQCSECYLPSCGAVFPVLLTFMWGSVPCVTFLHVGQCSLRYFPSCGAVFPALLAYMGQSYLR
jgi:hypothetical protein